MTAIFQEEKSWLDEGETTVSVSVSLRRGEGVNVYEMWVLDSEKRSSTLLRLAVAC